MALLRCVNCGLYGGKKQVTPKITKPLVLEKYFMVLLCMHCHKIPADGVIVCEYGYKREMTKEEAMKYLTPEQLKALA